MQVAGICRRLAYSFVYCLFRYPNLKLCKDGHDE